MHFNSQLAAIIISNENILAAHALKFLPLPKFILEAKIVRKRVVNTVVQ